MGNIWPVPGNKAVGCMGQLTTAPLSQYVKQIEMYVKGGKKREDNNEEKKQEKKMRGIKDKEMKKCRRTRRRRRSLSSK